MPILDANAPTYKPQKMLEADWNTWRQGYNSLLRPTELKPEEYAQGDNIMLIGSGVPTGRWGTVKFFTAGATGSVRGFGLYATGASVSEILALTDQGYIFKKSGSSSTLVAGASYPSGTVVRAEQLGGKTYFVSNNAPMAVYNGNSLVARATLTTPSGLTATNVSGVSGTYTYSWKIVGLSSGGGHTAPSTAIELPNLPQDLSKTTVRVTWTGSSGPSISGYEIYRGFPGDETYLAAVGASTTAYFDTGETPSQIIVPPIANTTGGIKSKFIRKVGDRLVAVDATEPSKLLISGRYPYQDSYNWADGGGYVYIDPDSGQDITGVEVQMGSDKIIVFKNYSSYQVTLNTATIGNYVVLDPQVQQLSALVGCSNPDTIQIVENDVFYFGRKGIYVIGYEPNFLNIIRTNEISARIRPYLDALNEEDYSNACSMYVDNKYILSFPNRKEMIAYDRERGCFLGIWKLPFGIAKMVKYVDETGTERWVLGSADSNQVYTFEPAVNSDDGTTISKTLRLKKEYFNSWSLLKIIHLFYIMFRNITGSVTVNILLEDRNGTTTTAKTFTITGSEIAGNTGWGADLFGTVAFGDSHGEVTTTSEEFTRWGQLYKQCRLLQVEIVCDAANSNFELLGVRITAQSQGEGQLSSSQRV